MKHIVFGSLNIDRVYPVPHLPRTGEMLRSGGYEIHVGGKGLNQALALQRAGLDTAITGLVGTDGHFLVEYLFNNGVDVALLGQTDTYTGHAVIMIDPAGRNQMIIFPGANREIDENYCETVLSVLSAGDVILMQYETSCVEYMMKKAKEKGLIVAFNPSPFVPEVLGCPFENVDYLYVNEQEGELMTGRKEPEDIVTELSELNPKMKIILTLGSDGAVYADENSYCYRAAFKVAAEDTTGAGDTFTGYSLKMLLAGESPADALKTASAASALAVMKKGAAETIPTPDEVEAFLKAHPDSAE